MIIQHGGIESTAQAMNAHPDNAALALKGCFLLSNMSVVKGESRVHTSERDPDIRHLSNLHAESRELIVLAKGVERILVAIMCKSAVPELLELACTALYNLTLSGTCLTL